MQEILAAGCLVPSITYSPRVKEKEELISKCCSLGEGKEAGRQITTLSGDLPPCEQVHRLRKFCVMH